MSTTMTKSLLIRRSLSIAAIAAAVCVGTLAPLAGTAVAATTKPDASNTGVPASRVLPRYTGPLTITADNTVIDGKDIYGDLKVQARNVVIQNSRLHCGTTVPPGATGCIDANHANVYNLTIQRNTIKPDKPSYYRDGIVGHEFTARYNDISRSNDGIGIFNRPGGSVNANVTVEGNFIHDLTHFNYSPTQKDGTHNDGIQIQGGTNIAVRGNNIVASAVAGDSSWTYAGHANAGIMMSQNVSPYVNVVIEGNWFNKGQAGVAITNGKFSTAKLTLQRNYFGRDQYAYGGTSRAPIRIYNPAATSATGVLTNTWQDTGTALAVGKNLGIYYG